MSVTLARLELAYRDAMEAWQRSLAFSSRDGRSCCRASAAAEYLARASQKVAIPRLDRIIPPKELKPIFFPRILHGAIRPMANTLKIIRVTNGGKSR